MNKRLTKEQAMEIAVEMERKINAINSRQYIGMPRDELKKIIMTVFHKKANFEFSVWKTFCRQTATSKLYLQQMTKWHWVQ